MPETGTVTLLFTDLVGSTEALVALGEDRFDSVRDEHDALVGGTIPAYHGEVVKYTGDGYMAAFRRAGDAIAAATPRYVVQCSPRLQRRCARSAAARGRGAELGA